MGKVTKASAPDHLTMNLFAPGMSPLHRAGLGGLACTLKAMERQYEAGLLSAERLPAPFKEASAPWVIEEHGLRLDFGTPENAANFLKRLFAFAFAVRQDGLISLPGQYDSEPAAAVLADLQAGMVLTFLQHGRVRQLAKEPTTTSYDPDGDGNPGVVVEYKKCSGFKHQESWEAFVDKGGRLISGPIKVDGPISPGTVVRHVAFTGDTAAEDPPDRMLPLCFALVGCMPLPVNRGVAALLVPDVESLSDFLYDRPAMSPTTAGQCQIANAADAALQAQIRLRGRQHIPGCYAMTFRPTAWASQQKSRVATIQIPPGEDKTLDRFERALASLPTRIVTRTVKTVVGRGKQKTVTERKESFRSESVVRPLIAENLALGRPWYAGFANLMTRINPATDKPYRNQLPFERKGLHTMMNDEKIWDQAGEAMMVRAVHEAIRQSLGRIRQDTDGENAKTLSQATKNRWERFREKLRLDLSGAKTESHVRFALMDLFSRGGNNSVLRDGWTEILPVIRRNWHLARDLGLLALASYVGKGESGAAPSDSEQR
jgi:CRISPR-associated protein Cas8a1/Csx13